MTLESNNGEIKYSLQRKIIHVDMDAFYASVEQRDTPSHKGLPVVVAWDSKRSVVCAASYEARSFGIHSAMPAARAKKLCPDAVFVAPNFERYRQISLQIKDIFRIYTDLIEPLSLDEAYLDVTENKHALSTATEIAKRIRSEIKKETDLIASAGVAPNKFLAKIASDWRKPDGLFVIPPSQVLAFLEPLPIRKIPGVGKATEGRLKDLGINFVGELRTKSLEELFAQFGKFGSKLYNLCRGVDESPVKANRKRKSLSVETTFAEDKSIVDLDEVIVTLCNRLWVQYEDSVYTARTIVIKLKTSDFRLRTKSHTPKEMPSSAESFINITNLLLIEIASEKNTRFRLAGVGLSNFEREDTGSEQHELF